MKRKIATVIIFISSLAAAITLSIIGINSAIVKLSEENLFTLLASGESFNMSISLPDGWALEDNTDGLLFTSANETEKIIFTASNIEQNVSISFQWAAFLLNIKSNFDESVTYSEGMLTGEFNETRYIAFAYQNNYYLTGLISSNGCIESFMYTSSLANDNEELLEQILKSVQFEKTESTTQN